MKQREIYAERLVEEINQMLENGTCFDEDKAKKEKHFQSITTSKSFYTIAEALDFALNVKKPDLAERSISCYKCDVKKYKDYLTHVGSSYDNVLSVDELQVVGFADYLSQVEGLQNKSMNLRIGVLKSLFEGLVERKIISQNSFRCIKKMQGCDFC